MTPQWWARLTLDRPRPAAVSFPGIYEAFVDREAGPGEGLGRGGVYPDPPQGAGGYRSACRPLFGGREQDSPGSWSSGYPSGNPWEDAGPWSLTGNLQSPKKASGFRPPMDMPRDGSGACAA